MKILNAVLAHKDFTWNDLSTEELKKYKVFTPNEIKTNIPDVCVFKEVPEYDNRLYSEISHLKYIRDNETFDWIVVNHYRRRLLVPDFKHVYIRTPLNFEITNKEFFKRFHDINDLNTFTDIILNSSLNTGFKNEWKNFLNDNYIISCNMVSCPNYIFYDWFDALCSFCDEFKKIKHIETYEDALKLYKDFIDTHKDTKDGYRILSFLAERFTSCYFSYYAKTLGCYPFRGMPLVPCPAKLLEDIDI